EGIDLASARAKRLERLHEGNLITILSRRMEVRHTATLSSHSPCVFRKSGAEDERAPDRERTRQQVKQLTGAVADQEMGRVQLPARCQRCDQIMAGRIRVMARERQRSGSRTKDPFRWSQRVDASAEIKEPAHRTTGFPRSRRA